MRVPSPDYLIGAVLDTVRHAMDYLPPYQVYAALVYRLHRTMQEHPHLFGDR